VKSLYLCDGHLGIANQKTDLIGLFNSIRPSTYPHVHERFVIFCQLIGGLGQMPFYFDITFAKTEQRIHTTKTSILTFERREKLIQLAFTMQNCQFPMPGTYLVEFYVGGQWISDTRLDLL
jgi:hypothetical protein